MAFTLQMPPQEEFVPPGRLEALEGEGGKGAAIHAAGELA